MSVPRPRYAASLPSTPRIASQMTSSALIPDGPEGHHWPSLFSAASSVVPGRRDGADGLGRVGTRGIRRLSSFREQLEGLGKLKPQREAIPGSLLQLLPSVRCKLGDWREATQHMQATQSTVKTAVGAEEDGEEGTVGGEAVEHVEMEDTGAADEDSEVEVAETGTVAEEEEARNAAAGRRVFEALVTGAANGVQLLVTVRVTQHVNQPPSTHVCIQASGHAVFLLHATHSPLMYTRWRSRPSIPCGLLFSDCG